MSSLYDYSVWSHKWSVAVLTKISFYVQSNPIGYIVAVNDIATYMSIMSPKKPGEIPRRDVASNECVIYVLCFSESSDLELQFCGMTIAVFVSETQI
jgi:hypothetical protein